MVGRRILLYLLLIALLLLMASDAGAASKKPSEAIKKNRCELKLVADYDFYRVIGDSNYANAARYLVNLVERINDIFTKVDWGLDIKGDRLINLGFSIKEIKIFDKPTNVSSHFNSPRSTREDGSFSALDVLKSFSAEEGTGSTCMTVLVSGKAFDHSVLGMANIGFPGERGICATEPIDGLYMNTAVITVRRKSELMITRLVDLVAAHELGHAWGSFHDDLDDPECSANSNQMYIMHESSNTGYDKSNYMFSPCSIRSVQKILYSQAHSCFVEEKSSLCGNGILEPGEECDAGGHLAGDTEDKCCTSDCKLRPGAVCSPKHSECCTSDCAYQKPNVVCQRESADTCRKEAHCPGNSSECPEAEPMEDGNKCADEGECRRGECVSFCGTLNKNWSNCLCENESEACLRCCRSPGATDACRPVTPQRQLAEGSICIHGQCNKGMCEKRVTDDSSVLSKIWKNFHETPSKKIFADYFVFIIVIVTLLIWFPVGAWIAHQDNQRHLGARGRRTDNDVVVVPTRRKFAS